MKTSTQEIIERIIEKDLVKELLDEGEYFFDQDSLSFIGHCSECHCSIGSMEAWHEDSDHCCDCKSKLNPTD